MANDLVLAAQAAARNYANSAALSFIYIYITYALFSYISSWAGHVRKQKKKKGKKAKKEKVVKEEKEENVPCAKHFYVLPEELPNSWNEGEQWWW